MHAVISHSSNKQTLSQLAMIEDFRTSLTPFLTDGDLCHFANSCKSFNRDFLTDEHWKKRVIHARGIGVFALTDLRLSSHFFSQYVQYRAFEEGSSRATEFLNRTLTSRLVKEWTAMGPMIEGEKDFLQTAKEKYKIRFIALLVPNLIPGILVSGMLIYSCYFPSPVREISFGLFLCISPIVGIITLPITAVSLHVLGIPQQIAGNVNVLRGRISKYTSKYTASARCRTVTHRVTTCWQAFNRGIQRGFSMIRNCLYRNNLKNREYAKEAPRF